MEAIVQGIITEIRRLKMARKRKKLARLTPKEDRSWVIAFCYYVDDGCSDLKADASAWRDICEEFPRLREYDGCLP
jgi:hypothetical protein